MPAKVIDSKTGEIIAAGAWSPRQWAFYVRETWEECGKAALATGHRLLEAERSLVQSEHGNPGIMEMYATLEMSPRTGQMLKTVARHHLINGLLTNNANHGSPLPASWRTLSELATLTDEQFEWGLETRRIRADMERKDVRDIKRLWESQRNEETAAGQIMAPKGRYETIVIDPPWPMEKIDRDERPNQAGFDYPTMNYGQLVAFPVEKMAAPDCHLFLWTTHKFLPMALNLSEAWGFGYVCLFTWHKNVGMKPFGMPMFNSEMALYCRRGSPKFLDEKKFFTCFKANAREHSRKPDEFYDVVKRVCDAPRIDVFSREAREGFDQYGLEVEKFAA
jgi:Transcriptional activator, adenine-specific DNA methyltransferase